MVSAWDMNGFEKPWYSSISSCLSTCGDGKGNNLIQKNSISVVRRQPESQTISAYHYGQNPAHARTWGGEPISGRVRATGLGQLRSRSFSPAAGQRQRSHDRIRRSQISGPTDFRHVAHDMFDLTDEMAPPRDKTPTPIQRPRRASYRPLELSIYLSNNNLSPLWTHFGLPSPPQDDDLEPVIAPPPAAVLADARDDAYVLSHQRSNSAMSFHLPGRTNSQRCSRSGSVTSQANAGSSRKSVGPRTTPPPALPEVSSLVQRIADAMIDLEQLQGRIEQVVKRQSVYLGGQSFGFPPFRQSLHRLQTTVPTLPEGGDGPFFSQRMRPQSTPLTPKQRRRRATMLSRPKRPQTIVISSATGPGPADMPLSAVSERRESIPSVAEPDGLEVGHALDRPFSAVSAVSAVSAFPATWVVSPVSGHPDSAQSNYSLASQRPESIMGLPYMPSAHPVLPAMVDTDSVTSDAASEEGSESESEHEVETEVEVEDSQRRRRISSVLVETEHPMTAVMLVSKRPHTVITMRKRSITTTTPKKRPASEMPKRRSRTAISSKRPLTLLTATRMEAVQEQKLAEAKVVEVAEKTEDKTVTVETVSLPKTQTKPSRPLTMQPAQPRITRSRQGYYSYMPPPRKVPARSSMDSLSTSSTISTTDDAEDMLGIVAVPEERLSRISCVSASDDDNSDVYVNIDAAAGAIDGDGLSVPPDGAPSKHVSFDFGLIPHEPMTLTFELSPRRDEDAEDGLVAIGDGVEIHDGVTFVLEPEQRSVVGVAY